jgi:hypothetical protein
MCFSARSIQTQEEIEEAGMTRRGLGFLLLCCGATTAIAAPARVLDGGKSNVTAAPIDAIIGAKGEATAGIYKVTIGRILFLHYWDVGTTEKLAHGIKGALDTQHK